MHVDSPAFVLTSFFSVFSPGLCISDKSRSTSEVLSRLSVAAIGRVWLNSEHAVIFRNCSVGTLRVGITPSQSTFTKQSGDC